jgi:hypothetical protein
MLIVYIFAMMTHNKNRIRRSVSLRGDRAPGPATVSIVLTGVRYSLSG